MYKCNIVYECIYVCTESGYFGVCLDFHSYSCLSLKIKWNFVLNITGVMLPFKEIRSVTNNCVATINKAVASIAFAHHISIIYKKLRLTNLHIHKCKSCGNFWGFTLRGCIHHNDYFPLNLMGIFFTKLYINFNFVFTHALILT